jgi:hypothetical protein
MREHQPVESQGAALPREWASLIHKLRWIGLDQEATCLESAVGELPPEQRCNLHFDPVETD